MKFASPRLRAALLAAAVLVPLTALSGHAQALPQPRDDSDARMSQYRSESLREASAVLEEWRSAWEKDDLRALMRFYDRKALVQLPGEEETRQGAEAVESALKTRLPALGGIEFGLVDAEVSGNLLYIFQRFLLQSNAADSAAAAPSVSGTTAIVMMRERGGWKIRAQMFVPAAPATAVAAQPTPASETSSNGN
ncbi:MAG TPA: nuclear transport factor 2 family protein [Longimicrobium sp.]|nr:nuclear transport factor 2 family protein [Longimicrobium sp.]